MNIPITGRTRFTGLVGSPVSHSISPRMHNESFRFLDLDYVYLCFDVSEQNLADAVCGLKTLGVRGFNLTMPCKNRMTELCDRLSPAARLIGAVNTVVHEENGTLTGYNTDGIGFMRSLKDAGQDIKGKTMTLLGAGGAAAAICTQAAIDGAQAVCVFARPTSRFWGRMQKLSDELSRLYPCRVTLADQADSRHLSAALEKSHLLVNGTSVGMAPQTDASLITDPRLFHPGLAVFDAIYNPRQTQLLKLAASAGCQTGSGLYMLLYQGAEAFALWTGQDMPIAHIKSCCFPDEPV